MKKLFIIAGVMSFLALGFSVQGEVLGENMGGMSCERVGKDKEMEKCCIFHTTVKGDKVFHTKSCHTRPVDGK